MSSLVNDPCGAGKSLALDTTCVGTKQKKDQTQAQKSSSDLQEIALVMAATQHQ